MDQSKVEHIVETNLKQLKRLFGLEEWDIKFEYRATTGDDPALCICDIDYKIANIVLDPTRIDDETGALHALKHELIHCVISTFQTYRLAVNCLLTEKECDATSIMFRRAEEEVACSFIRILEGKNEDQTM